jgi:APA family basic amino acid/polyamine antiporter
LSLGSEKVFTRQSTGLVRGISAHDVTLFTVLSSGPLFFVAFGALTYPSQFEGANLVLIMLLILPLLLCIAYNVSMLGAAMPRAGGDYVFGSRVIHPVWGLLASANGLMTGIVGIGTLPPIAFEFFLAPTLLTSFPNSSLATSISSALSYPPIEVIVGIITIAAGFGLVIKSAKSYMNAVKVIQYIALIVLLILIVTLLSYNNDAFQKAFNAYGSKYNMTYLQVFSKAEANGWTPPSFSVSQTIAVLILSLFFVVSPGAVVFGGEIKEAKRNIPLGMIAGMAIAWLFPAIAFAVWFRVIPFDFTSALSTISSTSSYSLPFPLSVNYLIQILTKNSLLSFIIGLGITIQVIGFTFVPMLVITRIMFAWSFDRLIPQKFSSVSSKTGTPVFSILVAMIMSILILVVDVYTNIVSALFATTLLGFVAFIPNGFTGLLFPFRRKDLFQNSPSLVTKKIGRVPLIAITGLVQGVSLALMLFTLILLFPSQLGPVNSGSLGITAAIATFAIVLYPIARVYRLRKDGIDISWAYKSLPPE